MITIIYGTGNGYRCSCCRRTTEDNFDAETEQEAIDECINIARNNEWDFYIDRIIGHGHDEYGLEQKIMAAIKAASADETRRKDRARIVSSIHEDQAWLAKVDQEIERRKNTLAANQAKLKAFDEAVK